jgi:putative glycosyltransferase (TIGR04372 family)
MICKNLSNANTSHLKCLLATLIDSFIFILVLFHKLPKKETIILVEPFIVPSLGDTSMLFHYAWLKSIKESKETYTILPRTRNMKYCFEFANIFCKPENIEEYNNPIFNFLIFLLPDKYISYLEVILLNKLRQKYDGIKTYFKYDEIKDKVLKDISKSDMKEAYLKKNYLDNFGFYGHKKYHEILNSSHFKKLDIDSNNDHFKNLKNELKLKEKYICVHIKQQEGYLYPRFVFEKENYIKTFNYLIESGYQIVLLGDKDLSILKMDGLVNYCKSKFQNVFNDILLIKNCNFFICNASGPLTYPHYFRIPHIIINAVGMSSTMGAYNERIVPKNIYRDGKRITIQDFFQSPIYYFDTNDEFERLGYEYKDNSEDEIYNSILEFKNLVNSNDFSLTSKQEDFKKNICNYHMAAYHTKGFIADYVL